MLFQPALASEPIVQNLIVIMLSALAPTEIIKLENAVNNALTTVPARISLVVVILPCPAAIPRTITVAITAPTNAPPETNVPSPITISRVAPNVAPDETPRIYGSDIGLLTVACITHPHNASPAPANKPRRTLGNLIFQTIAIIALLNELYISSLCISFPRIILYVSDTFIFPCPSDTAVTTVITSAAIRKNITTAYNVLDLEISFTFSNLLSSKTNYSYH